MATQIGVVTAVIGTVTATATDGTMRNLQIGDIVYANELISTGPAAAVEIQFADGSVMNLGRDSQIVLDNDVYDPDAAGVTETIGQTVSDDIDAIQQAILAGEDPTENAEATAAGAGAQGSEGGHDAVFVEYLNPEVIPEAGFQTAGVEDSPTGILEDIEEDPIIPVDEIEEDPIIPDDDAEEDPITPIPDMISVALEAEQGSVSEDQGLTLIATLDQTASAEIIVTLSNGENIVIAAGELTGTITIPPQGDDPYIDAEVISTSITSVSGETDETLSFDSTPVLTSITDTIDTTFVTLGDVIVDEGAGTATIEASVGNPVTVSPLVITLENQATITIPVGGTTGTSTEFALQDDDVYQDGESYTVGIESVSGGDFEALDTTDTANVNIDDTRDAVTATLTTSTNEISEDGGDVTYTISLSGGPGEVDPVNDLVFNLTNGEQVTIPAGQTSGTHTRSYTDDEIGNQTSISNSIANIASGGNEYEDLQTAGTTTIDVDYTPEIINLTPAAEGGDVLVGEDDLSDGTDSSKEPTIQQSTFTINSGDPVDSLTIEGNAVITNGAFSATSFTTGLGNTLSVIGYNADSGELIYTYELLDNTLNHGTKNNDENSVFEDFEVLLTDTDGNSDTDTLSVNIVDDVPLEQSVQNTLEVPISDVKIAGFKSTFTNADDGSNVSFTDGESDGLGGDIDRVRWGGNDNFSSYTFDAALSGTSDVEVNSEFSLGTFTHNNFSIPSGTAIDSVDLNVSFTVDINSVSTVIEKTISFDHNETPNNSGSNPNDIITITNGTEVVDLTVGDRTYQFEILGFQNSEGETVTSILTEENEASTFNLIGKLSSTDGLPTIDGQVETVFGADGPADDASVSWENGKVTDEVVTSGVIQGDYGVLTVDAEGNYRYEVDREVRDNLDIDESFQEAFTYFTTDADGDRVENVLIINVNGTSPPAEANPDSDTATEQSAVIDGTASASITVDEWSDDRQITYEDQLKGNDKATIDPKRNEPDEDTTSEFSVTADADHPAIISSQVVIKKGQDEDEIEVQLLKDGVAVQSDNSFSVNGGTVTFNVNESGNYALKIIGQDLSSKQAGNSGNTSSGGNLKAQLEDLVVSAYTFGSQTLSTTVNNAAIVAAVAASGNVLANDLAGPSGIELKSVDGTEIDVTGQTTITGLYGDLQVSKDGEYIYTPNEGNIDLPEDAAENFEYTIIDSSGNSEETATLTIDVKNVDYSQNSDDNVVLAENGGQIVDAREGNDALLGSKGNDILIGGVGNDLLKGMEGDDTLTGGPGNDILAGGDGADSFEWNKGDDGTEDDPAVDFVTDFNTNEGDVLKLTDLLDPDGSKTINESNLDDYLKATFDSDSNQTKIDVYTQGDANNGGQSTQSIVVNGNQLDLTTLLNNNNLQVDQGGG